MNTSHRRPIVFRPALRLCAAAALLVLGTTLAHAQEAEAGPIAAAEVPGPAAAEDADTPAISIDIAADIDTLSSTELATAVQAGLVDDVQADSIVPIPAIPRVRTLARPISVARALAPTPPSVVRIYGDQAIQLHADGLPAANVASRDSLEPVLPRAVNPADVAFGARWGAQDRIQAPLLSAIAWDAHADLLAGAAPARAQNVRHSLRLTAQWDTPEDLKFGVTPGVERGGGSLFEHYVYGLQATTLDKSQTARWSSFVEVSGENLASTNLIENSTAQVHAGASYMTPSSVQFDVSVTRGTTAVSDLQSSVGLSMHF